MFMFPPFFIRCARRRLLISGVNGLALHRCDRSLLSAIYCMIPRNILLLSNLGEVLFPVPESHVSWWRRRESQPLIQIFPFSKKLTEGYSVDENGVARGEIFG